MSSVSNRFIWLIFRARKNASLIGSGFLAFSFFRLAMIKWRRVCAGSNSPPGSLHKPREQLIAAAPSPRQSRSAGARLRFSACDTEIWYSQAFGAISEFFQAATARQRRPAPVLRINRRSPVLQPILAKRSTALVKSSSVLSGSPCSMPSRMQCLMWPSNTT